jgi:hypothetical protein
MLSGAHGSNEMPVWGDFSDWILPTTRRHPHRKRGSVLETIQSSDVGLRLWPTWLRISAPIGKSRVVLWTPGIRRSIADMLVKFLCILTRF